MEKDPGLLPNEVEGLTLPMKNNYISQCNKKPRIKKRKIKKNQKEQDGDKKKNKEEKPLLNFPDK